MYLEIDIDNIRQAERASHLDVYASHQLYEPGSWLAKPVKTVLDILPMLDHVPSPRILDLGCGVGRNAIAVARHFSSLPCHVDCVDLLEYAIEKLNENAVLFDVVDAINGIISPIDTFEILPDQYDLILAVSALEHVDSVQTFMRKLDQIRNGLRPGGIACLIVNSGVTETDTDSGTLLPPQFEVILPTAVMKDSLDGAFHGCTVLKSTTVHQMYTVPRGDRTANIETDVVTLVVQKP